MMTILCPGQCIGQGRGFAGRRLATYLPALFVQEGREIEIPWRVPVSRQDRGGFTPVLGAVVDDVQQTVPQQTFPLIPFRRHVMHVTGHLVVGELGQVVAHGTFFAFCQTSTSS